MKIRRSHTGAVDHRYDRRLSLEPGDVLEITYGDKRFGGDGVRVQTFAEPHVNVVAFVQPLPGREFFRSRQPVRPRRGERAGDAPNVAAPSIHADSQSVPVRISITDNFHCVPTAKANVTSAPDGQVVNVRRCGGATSPQRADVVAAFAGRNAKQIGLGKAESHHPDRAG